MLNINGSYVDLNKTDLIDLLCDITETTLQYRTYIGVSTDLTFGTEIEFEGIRLNQVKKDLSESLPRWKFVRDSSIPNQIKINPSGGEIVSSILSDKTYSWDKLKLACTYLKENGAYITNNCGGHVNIGTQILGSEANIIKLLQLWVAFEDIIYRFSYGKSITNRRDFRMYAIESAYNLKKIILNSNATGMDIIRTNRTLYGEKNKGISFVKMDSIIKMPDNVIEVRCPNGTIDEVDWQNNINFFVKLFKYAASLDFDTEKVLYYADKREKNDYALYDEIYLKKALELADMIFTKDIDKYYFLKQYLKNFEIKSYYDEYVKCK